MAEQNNKRGIERYNEIFEMIIQQCLKLEGTPGKHDRDTIYQWNGYEVTLSKNVLVDVENNEEVYYDAIIEDKENEFFMQRIRYSGDEHPAVDFGIHNEIFTVTYSDGFRRQSMISKYQRVDLFGPNTAHSVPNDIATIIRKEIEMAELEIGKIRYEIIETNDRYDKTKKYIEKAFNEMDEIRKYIEKLNKTLEFLKKIEELARGEKTTENSQSSPLEVAQKMTELMKGLNPNDSAQALALATCMLFGRHGLMTEAEKYMVDRAGGHTKGERPESDRTGQ